MNHDEMIVADFATMRSCTSPIGQSLFLSRKPSEDGIMNILHVCSAHKICLLHLRVTGKGKDTF